MAPIVTDTATRSTEKSSRPGGFHTKPVGRYVTGMVTKRKKPADRPAKTAEVVRIHKGKHPHLYVEEHMQVRGITVPMLAHRLDQHEKSVYRSLREQGRIWKEIEVWADALGLEDWRDLTLAPNNPSVDARIDALPADFRDLVYRAIRKP